MFGFSFHALSIWHMQLKSSFKRVDDDKYNSEEEADKREYACAGNACQPCNISHTTSHSSDSQKILHAISIFFYASRIFWCLSAKEMVFKRETCTNLGQGCDVLMSSFDGHCNDWEYIEHQQSFWSKRELLKGRTFFSCYLFSGINFSSFFVTLFTYLCICSTLNFKLFSWTIPA